MASSIVATKRTEQACCNPIRRGPHPDLRTLDFLVPLAFAPCGSVGGRRQQQLVARRVVRVPPVCSDTRQMGSAYNRDCMGALWESLVGA